MQHLRITNRAIAHRLAALNSDAVAHGCSYDARRTGRLWVIYMTTDGSTMARTVADCLTSRECFAMLYGLMRGRQHQHDDRLREVFGPTALGQVTPAAVTSRGLETADGDAVCEFCNRVGPGRPAMMGEDTVHYCEACRSADAG
jgi:hypothetical protein